jgi:putative transposase
LGFNLRRNKLRLYLHLVWATWDRLPLISDALERRLFRCIEAEAHSLDVRVLALNGMPDHVHLVVSLPATLAVADLAKQVKGASSRFVNEVVQLDTQFKWQGGYGAFTVSQGNLETVVAYVIRQKELHNKGTATSDWEETFEEVPQKDEPGSPPSST